MTTEIQYLQKHIAEQQRNVKLKVFLKELIDKRKKFLKFMRRWDYKRFEWVLEHLNLIYVPQPKYDALLLYLNYIYIFYI